VLRFEVREGDIAAVEADAVANAANGRTTRSCLELADELGCNSLALPAFGTGVGGFRSTNVRGSWSAKRGASSRKRSRA
jgi:O-acetyl-ADP-ribose deacetylase (regulator of RNase III)